MAEWTDWLPLAAFWLLLFLLAAAETLYPLHRAPREGKGRLVANFGLGVINAALLSAAPVAAVAAAQWAQQQGVGLLNTMALPFAATAAATLLVRSFAAYAMHRISHSWPWLWRLHRVHHSDTAVDLSTSFRNHPFELTFALAWRAAVTVAFGLDPLTLVAYEAAAAAFALWDHANLRLPARLDQALRLVLVTPAMHHVHHSAARAETDSNYGDVISLWDRLFGTYRQLGEAEVRAARFGLGDAEDEGAASLVAQLRSPLARGGAVRPVRASEA
jgi:sterol desaturase/sphingolipid hydroxylase (fatty acid hydroxylase superfamily)